MSAINQLLGVIYALSIVTILYRASTKLKSTPELIFTDWMDTLFILFLIFCPVLNTAAAIMALIAMRED